MKNSLLASCLLFLMFSKLLSQDINRLTLHLDNASFDSLVNLVEEQHDIRVFYDEEATDTLRISLDVENELLSLVFSIIFEGTKFNYYLYEDDLFILYDKNITISTISLSDTISSDAISTVDFFEVFYSHSDSETPLIEVGTKTSHIVDGNATISGRVRSSHDGGPIIGASIYIDKPLIGTYSNADGEYSLTIPRGAHDLKITNIGMMSTEYKLLLYSDGILNVELKDDFTSLNEVVVESARDENFLNAQLGIEKISSDQLKLIPSALGEQDIIKVLLTFPGVKTVGEASNGFNVRGGSTDQNLILLNESTIYNPSHLFGFFSAFNSDIVEDAKLYKGSIPAKYGGRLSSVLQVTTKEGSFNEFNASGGIGPVTGRFYGSIPLIKEKTSLSAGIRGNYSNWILSTLKNPDYANSRGSFYDANIQLDHIINDESRITVYGYQSSDEFKLRDDTVYKYSNKAASIKYSRSFGDKLYNQTSFGLSSYNYQVSSQSNPVNAFLLNYDIEQIDLNTEFDLFSQSIHNVSFGVNYKDYRINPGALVPLEESSIVTKEILENERAVEKSVFVNDEIELSQKITLNLGARFTNYRNRGPGSYFLYDDRFPKSDETIVDTIVVSTGGLIKQFNLPSFRASARYSLSASSSVKGGFTSLNQFIHRLSNTVSVSPTDIWKLSDFNIRPQQGYQLFLGYFKNFKGGEYEASLEGYYKEFKNFLDYKSGAVLIMNPNIEADIINTKGRSYGVELLIKKTRGRLTGWFSYSYSRSLLKQDDNLAGELINNGAWYPANFDKPHDASLFGNFQLTKRFSFSLNVAYSTGRPVTIPLEQFSYGGTTRLYYSERNEFRVPDYFRTDIGLIIEGSHKLKKLAHGSWTIGVYNLTGRRNANSIYFVSEDTSVNGYRLSIFGKPIPTISYNFKF